MEFYYFSVEEQYAKQSLFKRTLSSKLGRSFVQKKIVQPLTQSSLSLFHLHEIKDRLFHIVVVKKGNNEVFNCLYDINQQLFFFEKDVALMNEIQHCPLWLHLSSVNSSMKERYLYTKDEILSIINR